MINIPTFDQKHQVDGCDEWPFHSKYIDDDDKLIEVYLIHLYFFVEIYLYLIFNIHIEKYFLSYISKTYLVADVTVDVGSRICLQNTVNSFPG